MNVNGEPAPSEQYQPDMRPASSLRDARRSLTHRAQAAKESAADQLIGTAEWLRAEAFRLGDAETIRQAQQVSRRMERTAVYLHGHTFDQITGDARQMVEAKPWQAVFIAFLLGVIFGRTFQRTGRRQ